MCAAARYAQENLFGACRQSACRKMVGTDPSADPEGYTAPQSFTPPEWLGWVIIFVLMLLGAKACSPTKYSP